VCKTFFSI